MLRTMLMAVVFLLAGAVAVSEASRAPVAAQTRSCLQIQQSRSSAF
jgi:hypothetical protein